MMTRKVSISSIKLSLFKLRRLAVALVFLFAAQGVWGATYYWVGKGTDNGWKTENNWDINPDGTGSNAYPGENDIVYIRSVTTPLDTTTTTIDIGSTNVKISGISLGTNNLSESFTVEIKGDGTLEVTGSNTFTDHNATNDKGIVTFRPTNTGDASKVSSLILNCNVISPSLCVHSGGNVTINKNACITNVVSMATNDNTPTNMKITGSLISDTITIANYSNQVFEIDSGGFVFSKPVTTSGGTYTNNGTFYEKTSNTQNIWLGRADTNWNNLLNWSLGSIPNSNTAQVKILNTTNKPVIPDGLNITVSSIVFEAASEITINGKLEVKNDLTVDTTDEEKPATFNGDIYVGGDLRGPFKSAENKKVIFNGSGDQTFYTIDNSSEADYIYNTIIEEDKSLGNLIIGAGTSDRFCKIAKFIISQGTKTIFTDYGGITLFTDSSDAGDIEFQKGIYIEEITDETFYTTGKILFGDKSKYSTYISNGTYWRWPNSHIDSGITHTSGETEIFGQLFTWAGPIEFATTYLDLCDGLQTYGGGQTYGAVILKSYAGLVARGGKIQFNSTIDSEVNGISSISVDSYGDDDYGTIFSGDIGQTGKLKSIEVYGPLEIAGCTAITTTEKQYYRNEVILGNDITFTSEEGSTEDNAIEFKSSVNSKTDETHSMTLSVPTTKAIEVTGAVGDSDPVSLTITQAESVTFKDTVSIKEFSDSSQPIDITFEKGGTINASGNVVFDGEVTSSDTFSITATNLTFNADAVVNNITIDATTTTSNDITVTGNWTNNGSFTASGGTVELTATTTTDSAPAVLSGSNTFNNLTISGNVNITGSNEIDTLTASGLGGKTISFAPGTTQTITGTLTLSGTDVDNTLSLTSTTGNGQWTIECSDSAPTLTYLTVKNSINSDGSTVTPFYPTASIDGGGNTNWVFLGVANSAYTWTGNASTDWNTSTNWSPAAIPVTGAVITIPAGCTNYPVLPDGGVDIDDGDPSTEYGTITIASGASLDFNGQPLTVKSITNNGEIDFAGGSLTVTTITNNGTVRLLGTETITGDMKNGDDNQSGTVEYYGSEATFDFVWDGSSDAGKQYANIIINRLVTQSTDAGKQLVVSGTTTISAGTGKAVSLNNTSNTFTGSVKIGDYSSNPRINAGAITLKGTGVSIDNNAYADSLDIYCPVSKIQNVTTTGDQIYRSTVVINTTGTTSLQSTGTTSSITFEGDVSGQTTNTNVLSVRAAKINLNCSSVTTGRAQTYIGEVTLGADEVTLTSNSRTITFGSTTIAGSIDGNKLLKLSVPTGRAITFYSKIGETERPSITITQAGTINFNETVKANTVTITQVASTTFTKAVDIGTFTDATTHTGTITFNGGGTISNATGTTFNTSGIVSFTGTDSNPMNIGTASSFANLTHTAGTTNITGKLNAAEIQLGTANITNGNISTTSISAGAVTIAGANTTVITTTGTQSYNGNFQLNGNASLSSTSNGDINFGSTIKGTELLTLTVPTTNDITVTGAAGNATNKPSIKIMQAGSTTFTGSVNLTSFEDDSGHTGNITFSNGGTITNAVTFNTTGDVSITGTQASPMNIGTSSDKNLTHENGATTITGYLNAAEITLGTTSGLTTITSGEITAAKIDVGNLKAAGKITTTNEQNYNGTVELTDGLTLKSNNSSITFTQTITGAKALSVDSSTGTNFGGDVGTEEHPIASLSVTGPSTIGCSNIYTSGTQSFGGDVTLGTDTALEAGGNINFGSKIDGNHTISLSVPNNTTNTISVTGAVGSLAATISDAPSITIAQAGSVTFKDTVKDNEFTITKANSTTFDKAVEIGTFSDDSLIPADNGNITFKNGGTITNAVTFNTTGDVSITGTQASPMNIGASSDKNLTHQAGNTNITGYLNAAEITLGTTSGLTTITSGVINGSKFEVGNLKAAGTITTSGEQKYNGTVELTDGLTLKSDTSSITFAQTITGEKALSVDSSAGTSFGGNVGTLGQPVVSLSVTGPSTIGCSNIYTSGAQSYSGAVTLATTPATHTLTASGITFDASSTINGAAALAIVTTAGINFGADIGGDTPPTSLTVTGPSTINCSNISTSGAQSFGGDVTLGTDTALTSGGNISFRSAIKGTNKITLTVPTNKVITVTGTTGDATNKPSVKIMQAGSTTFTETVNLTSFEDDSGHTGNITFGNGGTITNAVTFNTTGDVSITGTQASPMNIGTSSDKNLTHENGATTITGYLNAAEITLGTTSGLTTITSGEITAAKIDVGNLKAAGKITTTNEQNYNGTVELTDGLTLKSDNSSITFAQTITGAKALSVDSSTGTSFGGNVGTSGTKLASLTVTGPSTIGCSNIYTSGAQSYSGAVVLGADTIMTSANGSISFALTIDSKTGTNHSLSLDAKTGTTFNGKVGNVQKLSVLDVKGKATITSACTEVNTTQSQTYKDDVEISSAANGTVSLTADTKKITFKKNVLLGKDLNVTANGSEGGISFTAESDANANVYGSEQLTLTAGANAINFTATAGTEANQLTKLHIISAGSTTFEKAVYIGTFTDDDVDTTDNGNITFSNGGTITNAVTFNTTGDVSITGTQTSPMNIGTSPSYVDLTHTAGATSITGYLNAANLELGNLNAAGTITTTGTQEYNGAVVLGADTTMKSNNSSISFASTIDSKTETNHSLSLDTKTGTTFTGPVGNTTDGVKLSLLDVKGKATITAACTQINTTQNQIYQDDVEISSAVNDTVSLSADTEKITFKKNVLLGKDLSVDASGSNGGISFTAESDANANVYGSEQLTLTAGANAINFTATAGTEANQLAKLHINSAGSTTFEKAVYIGTFTDDAAHTGAITFKHGGTILSDTEIHTSQNVTLTDTLTLPSLQMNNLIVDGTANINTTSSQTYKGTINGKTTNTDVLNLRADSGTITFKGNIGGALPLKTLSIVGETSIDCSAITTSGAQNYSGEITLSTTPTPHTLTASAITFDASSTINGAAALALETTAGTSFGANIGDNTPPTLLTVTGPATIGCTAITTSGNQQYKDDVVLTNSPTLTSNTGNIAFDKKIDGTHTITLSVPNNTTNSITVTGAVGSAATTTSAAPSVTIAQAGTVTFKETVKANAFTITKANNTTFEDTVEIAAFADDDTNHTGTITFKKGADISDPTVIHTQGIVTLTDTLTTPSLKMNNLIVDGTANINTTGAQIYDGTINGKTASTDILNLDSGTGHITFNGDIGQSLPPLTLNVTGETTINCAAITTSGTQTYNNAITLGISPAPETHTLTASGLSFVSTIDGAANLVLETTTTAGTNFAANIGDTTPPTSLTITGPATIDCTAITTTGNQQYKNAVTLTASPTLTSTGGNLSFDSTLDGEYTITLDVPANPANTITVAGRVGETSIPSVTIAQAGNVSFAETVKTTDFIITKANDSHFAKQVDSSTFVITQADNTLFNKAVNVTSFAITQAATTTFDEVVQISTFADAATAGDISFKNGGTISTATQFKTQGTVTFGDAAADTMTFGTASPYENLTHTAGETSITGILNAAAITLADTSGGPMTITNSGLFKTVDGAALTYTASFAQNGSGNSVLGGSFTGNGNASFATDVQLYGSSQADFGAAETNISIAKNLIIIRVATDDLTINSNATVTENLVLYKGPVVANADITAGKDILVLGSAYSETDTSTGITNEYAYDCVRPETWSQINYIATTLPDGTVVPEALEGPACNYSSSLSVSTGKTITAGKNFYANGTTLSLNGTSGQWTLKVPDLTNAANAFAESYHSQIAGCKVICSTGNSADGTKARLVCLECGDTSTSNTPNTNVDFDDFEITAAWTERDNSIRVEFNRPVRYYDATVQTLKFQNADGSPSLNFTGLYSDPDCQTEIKYDTEMSYFYIKAAPQNDSQYGAWNTDATGRSSGADDDQSTDRSGIHHENIPALDFARALVNNGTTQSFIFTDRWGKRLNNYSARTPTAKAAYGSTDDAEATHEVADKTGPVLYSVRTGQELHDAYDPSLGQAGEHSYDAHNFIEFVYSEKVDFDSSSDDSTLNDNPATAENVQVNDSLGAVKGDITKADNLQLAGLGILQNGLLYTGSNGSANKYVSALYRKGTNAAYAIRLSIAGYTDPAVTLTDDDGYTYKKWIGYIEQATLPSGTVKHLVDSNNKNERVKDKDGNVQIKYADDKTTGEPVFDTIPVINSTPDGLYGTWDLSEPVFALYRQNAAKTHWDQAEFNKNYYAEAIGNNSGVGSTLDRIEFHLYDNTPQFDEAGAAVTDTPEWFTEVGWCNPGTSGEKPQDLYKTYSYAADIFGGSRAFDSNAANRTSGGIRYSTIYSSVKAFKYGIGSKLSENHITTAFDNSKIGIPGASSLIFTGTSSPRRSAGDSEGLYFAMPLANTSLDIKTSFTVKYDDSVGFITDLAGNRLRSTIISTIDRTPPSIDMTVCPVGGDELEIIFVKELCVDSDDLEYNDNTTGEKVEITQQFESLITNCFDFITIDSSGNYHEVTDLKVDNTVPAKITIKENINGSFFTSMRLKLTRTVTLEDVKTKFIRITYPEGYYEEYSVDLFTGHPGSRVTFIQDENGNNIQMYTAHALSDFAVGTINPLYAYDSAMTEDDGTIISDSLFRTNLTDDVDVYGWSVHDWNRDQQNYGTLPAKRPVAIVADTSDGTESNENAPDSFRLYLTNKPDNGSVSTQYNKDLEPLTQWRIWLPNEMTGVFTSLSEANNKNYSKVDGTLLSDDKPDRMIFEVDENITDQWAAGNQITFLFGLTNSDGTPVTIMHSPELDINNDKQYLSTSAKMPLFALRQTDPQDLMSLDLWSFRLKTVTGQRGGVTILNNVIDAAAGEKVVVKVDVPEQGALTVLVMTLDGNIVDYLHRGTASEGEHFYSWDGTNRKGNPVARGMYFIRVTGPGLDETRKVLVVKE